MEELVAQVRAVVIGTDAYRRSVAEVLGISVPEAAALGELLHRGPLTPSALVVRLGLTSPSVTSLLDRLERNGFAVRRRHPADRRSVLVELTERGTEAIGPMFDMFTADIAAAVAAAEPQHVKEVAELLARIASALLDRAADRPGIAACLVSRGSDPR